MRVTLHLHKLSLYEIAIWCRENAVAFVAVKRTMRLHRSDGRRVHFYYPSRRIIDERMTERHNNRTDNIFVLFRPDDYVLFTMRFGAVGSRGWDRK